MYQHEIYHRNESKVIDSFHQFFPKPVTMATMYTYFILKLGRRSELARAVDVNDGASKENIHFESQSEQVVFLFF